MLKNVPTSKYLSLEKKKNNNNNNAFIYNFELSL